MKYKFIILQKVVTVEAALKTDRKGNTASKTSFAEIGLSFTLWNLS